MNIVATSTTPAIRFDEAAHTLEISGESYPENSFEFYRPLLAWLGDRLASGPLVLRVAVTYMNTSTVKCMMDVFDRLEEAHHGGADVRVVWTHNRGDERARELGEEFKEDLSLPFTLSEHG